VSGEGWIVPRIFLRRRSCRDRTDWLLLSLGREAALQRDRHAGEKSHDDGGESAGRRAGPETTRRGKRGSPPDTTTMDEKGQQAGEKRGETQGQRSSLIK